MIERMKENKAYAASHFSMPNELQIKAKKLCKEYNNLEPDEENKKQEILSQLFGEYNPLVFIEPDFRCDYGYNIHFHGLALINYNCVILDTSPVNIGNNVYIAPGVCIACAGHAINKEQRREGVLTSAPITIEDDVWIGANVTVCAGVTIKKGSIIGASSVVVSDIAEGVIAAGNPARVIRKITEADIIDKNKIY